MKKTEILDRILTSVFYNKSRKKASGLLSNSAGILQLLKNVFEKFQSESLGTVLGSVKNQILSLGKLLKYYATGQYRQIDLKNLVIVLDSLIYFLSPIDLIPDFLPVLGFTDDVALISFVFVSVSEELEKFENWLKENESDK